MIVHLAVCKCKKSAELMVDEVFASIEDARLHCLKWNSKSKIFDFYVVSKPVREDSASAK